MSRRKLGSRPQHLSAFHGKSVAVRGHGELAGHSFLSLIDYFLLSKIKRSLNLSTTLF